MTEQEGAGSSLVSPYLLLAADVLPNLAFVCSTILLHLGRLVPLTFDKHAPLSHFSRTKFLSWGISGLNIGSLF